MDKRRRKRNSLATEGTALAKPESAEKPSVYLLMTYFFFFFFAQGGITELPGPR